MLGIVIGFKDYNGMGGFSGIFSSEWVGLRNFENFFSGMYFWRLLGNALIISTYRLVFSFPAPIILALLLNEIYNQRFKRVVQTISYLPHFLSWVIIAGLVKIILATDGPVNYLLSSLGFQEISFLMSNTYFRGVLVLSTIWQSVGFNAIIFLAAISSIPIELYDSALVEGANRWQRVRYITLPSIYFIITIMLILAVGRILDENFEQIFNLYNPAVYKVADVFETFVYRRGIEGVEYSYAAAVGLFKSTVCLVMVWGSNKVVKLLGQDGIW